MNRRFGPRAYIEDNSGWYLRPESRLGCNPVHGGFITRTVDYLDRLFDR